MIFVKWKDIRLVIFDESYAQSLGLNTFLLKFFFITLLSAATVAALQTDWDLSCNSSCYYPWCNSLFTYR